MADKKVYTIEINGIKESADAVESLNKQLSELENRIKALDKSSVKVNTSSSSGGGSKSSSATNEEEKLAKQIEQIDAKRVTYSKEIYQNYLAAKDVLAETVNDQKAISAQERLQANNYTNTMAGLKQELKDLKTVMNGTDLADDAFKQMSQRAGEITEKLKGIEQEYGQFGRNVGNYANGVAEGMQKITINVGGVERTFNNAREASKTLGNELKTMAINGEQGTKAFKDMQVAVAKLNSDIKDATVSSQAMDNLLDTIQSFAAIGSVTQGLSALFGFDDDEIQKSIQKLVALQNVMQGIEKINQQINSQEGIGGWLAKGNSMIDSFVEKLTGASKAQKELNAVTTAGATASKELTAAEVAQTTATVGATTATKALSVAMKTIGIGLIISAVATLVTYWEEIYDWFVDTIPALKNLATWFDKIKAVAVGVGTAILNYMVQPLATLVKIIQAVINRNFSEIPNIIGSGLKKTFNIVGNYQKGYYKETERQQKVHNNKMLEEQKKANDEWLKDQEAKYGKSNKATEQYLKKQMELVEKQIANSKKGSKQYDELVKEQKELQRKIWENQRDANKKALADSKKNAKEVAEVEKEMTQLRINAMKEGLNKTITQLEEERKQRIAKLRENGNDYKKEEAEVNAIIDKKILDAKEKHAKDIENVYKDMWDKINANSLENSRKLVSMAEEAIAIQRQQLEDSANEYFKQGIGSYGIQGKNQLSPTTQFSLGINSENKSEFMNEMKDYIDLLREAQTAENEYNASYHEFYNEFNKLSDEQRGKLNMDLDLQKNYFEELKEQLNEYADLLKEKYGKEAFEGAKTALTNESYSSDLTSMFNQRISAVEAYWAKRKKIEAENAENLYKQQIVEAQKAWERESGATWDAYQKELKAADDFYKKKLELIEQNEKDGTITTKEAELEKRELEAEYKKTSKQMYQNYALKDEELRVEHNNKVVKLEQDKNNKLKDANAEYYQSVLQELRDFQTAQSDLESRQPVKNAWGITNRGKTNDNNRNLLASYEAMASKIQEKRAQVNRDFQNGIIDKKVFDSTIRELDRFSSDLGVKMDKVKEELSLGETIRQFIEDTQAYLQAGVQAFQQIMSAVWDAQDAQFEKEQEQLDKMNEALDEKLTEQQDIVEQHKNAIDSIEDELATSRGSRRQHLIDQLNAEMEAQKQAAKEQQRLEKEKEKLKAKEDALDKKRKQAQYKRDMTQAIVSGALAIVNALATNPFLPTGVAMAALAAAATATQIAIMASNKPYAKGGQLDGGVAQGKRHRDGGIPVLGGRASIEGGEYITNRVTTSKNVELLDYINSKKKKIDITDLMDFYSTTPRKTIRAVRTKFEDGGYLPTLPNALDVRDQLQNIVVNQDNRPIYVSVVDINNKQEDVRRVQTLAGL